jgi:hypothetical protein
MDTVIIGNQRYDMPSSDIDLVASATELLSTVKLVSPHIETEEQFETMYAILDEIEALVEQ